MYNLHKMVRQKKPCKKAKRTVKHKLKALLSSGTNRCVNEIPDEPCTEEDENTYSDDEDEKCNLNKLDMYEELKLENQNQLKCRTTNKINFIATTPAIKLIHFSRYASNLLPKLQESLTTFELKQKPPPAHNLEEVSGYLNASFDMGAGAVGFINYTWKEISDSGVKLVDSELQRVLIAKILINAVSPEKCVRDTIEATLVSVNLHSREASFEIRGLGKFPVVIFVGDIDACLLACASEQARQFIIPQVEMYVRSVMPNALEDGNYSHSSLEVLGNI